MSDQQRFSFAERWVTGAVVSRAGLESYLHLIRGPHDPERREKAKSLGGNGNTRRDLPTSWTQVRKLTEAEAREHILAALADGEPRTFNRIGVELYDKTADILFETSVDAALWSLVADESLEHTMDVPIRFRVRRAEAA